MLESLAGLADEVDRERIHALLLARAPSILEEGSPDAALLHEHLRSVASEVCAIVGRDPAAGPVRELATTALAYGVASEIEYSLFPEQQLGEDARGAFLRRRYELFLKRLETASNPSDPDAPVVVAGPLGSFPEPRPYPDPVERW